MKLTKQQELHQRIVEKAWEDEAFKNDLIKNPVETTEKLLGERIEIPKGKSVIVRDQTNSNKVYINIPSRPNSESFELSEEQLENVAGGSNSLIDAIGEILKDFLNPKFPPTIQ